jgi:glycosyltransferase involved in cell wall biosynthesis
MFRRIIFDGENSRSRHYSQASLYLCLSLSEGGAYSVCDAEAARTPIVTTDVGNYREFSDAMVIPWQQRDDPVAVGAAIERKLKSGRKECFYNRYSFDDWRAAWQEVVQ